MTVFSINSSSYLKCDYCTLSLQRDFVHNLALQIVQKKKKCYSAAVMPPMMCSHAKFPLTM